MQLLRFLTRESSAPKKRILAMAIISGGANGLLLVIVNLAAEQVSNHALETRLFFMYLIAFSLYVYTQYYALKEAMSAVEMIIQRVKLRIANKVRQVDLRFIEACGGISTFSPLTQDTNLITQATMSIVIAAQSSLVLTFGALYLSWLSPASLLISVTVIGLGFPAYLQRARQTAQDLHLASEQEGEFLSRFSGLLQGFKELKLSRRESDEVFSHLQRLTQETRQSKINANVRQVYDFIFGYMIFYLLLMLVVFILPLLLSHFTSEVLHKLIAAILFIIGPLGGIATSMPGITKTESAVNNLYELEARLDAAIQVESLSEPVVQQLQAFQQVRLNNLLFYYKNPQGEILFTSGPHNLDIRRGEMLFVVGGNGSGKSTFLKLLTGLYQQEQGNIYVDKQVIEREHYSAYRSLFSIVFTDFHLFKRLYGLTEVDANDIKQWLQVMQLDKKTSYQNNSFTNVDLSTGQRKRLAFIIAVLKNRPICIFDELAADQDPNFRQRFYEEILPGLKAQGRTVIVVTHDDQYFHLADRILKLQDGQILSEN